LVRNNNNYYYLVKFSFVKTLLIKNSRTIKLGLLLISTILLTTFAFSFIPVPRTIKTIDFAIINPGLVGADLPVDLPEYLSEELQILELKIPQWLWQGDPQTIILSIQPKVKDQIIRKQAGSGIEKYSVYLEARLELVSVQMLTGETVIEAVDAHQSALFNWQVNAVTSGRARGNLWIFVNITDSQSGKTWQLTRFALPLQMEIKGFIGLSINFARVFTLIGFILVLSTASVLFFFSSDYIKKGR
jgi:hypothetical protein